MREGGREGGRGREGERKRERKREEFERCELCIKCVVCAARGKLSAINIPFSCPWQQPIGCACLPYPQNVPHLS